MNNPSTGSTDIDALIDDLVGRFETGQAIDVERLCRERPAQTNQIRHLVTSLHLLAELETNGIATSRPGSNLSLRDELRESLSRESRLLKTPSMATASACNEPSSLVGETIGRYRVREKLGEGGFGIVYVAEQLRPVKRKVALKVIKPGIDSREVLARFEAERQALAIMDHPHIATVLDGGTTEDGRPYFVMELVRGIAITSFCDHERFNLRQKLELFVDVCLAVQHAHLKGIIHRDIKPSNVLVTMRDDQPVAKVIDFGVAKALHAKLSESTVYTAFGQVVGTPLYMSPEQIQLNELDVDTRSDIYSLGVLLYELITDETPFTRRALAENGIQAFRQLVCEHQPPRPSQRLSTIKASADPTVVDKRKRHPVDFKRISGELDWIVMKSLEKDRTRRYQSPTDFAEDVTNFLQGRAVIARPPTWSYVAKKYCQRHSRLLISAAGMIVFLSLGLALAWHQFNRADREARKYQEAYKLAQDSQEFLINDVFSLSDHSRFVNPKITVLEAIERVAPTLESRFRNSPLTLAEMHLVFGKIYMRSFDYSKARFHVQESIDIFRTLPSVSPRKQLDAKYALALIEFDQHHSRKGNGYVPWYPRSTSHPVRTSRPGYGQKCCSDRRLL